MNNTKRLVRYKDLKKKLKILSLDSELTIQNLVAEEHFGARNFTSITAIDNWNNTQTLTYFNYEQYNVLGLLAANCLFTDPIIKLTHQQC